MSDTTIIDPSASPVPADVQKAKPKGNPHWKGKPGKSGPPANLNAMKHGCYSARMTLGKFPKQLHNIARATCNYRRSLEIACEEVHGKVSHEHGDTIQAACRMERLARLWERRLADGYEAMDHATVAICCDRIERLTLARNKLVRSLGLDVAKGTNLWATIYAKPLPKPPASPVAASEPVGVPTAEEVADAAQSEGGASDEAS